MKKIYSFLLTATITIYTAALFAQINPQAQKSNALQKKMEQIIANNKADVGVSVIFPGTQKRVAVNGDRHYPMQSVYKFHLALAVLNQVDKGKLSLDQMIFIKKSDLLPNTWSPLRDKYPEGNVSVKLSEILKFTVSNSDNNGCDLLFRLIGGPLKVDQYIKKLGIKAVSIVATEEEMHKDEQVQFKNWSTPNATSLLLHKFATTAILKKATKEFLIKVMEETTTGTDKIKGLLPVGTVVAHKTGYSGVNEAGITTASNDIGIVTLPNGRKMMISIFVSKSAGSDQENDKIMAELSKAAWDEAVK